MTTFYFVASEQVITIKSSNVLDAWLSLTIKAKTMPIASEFRRLPIEAMDAEGNRIEKRTWEQWQDALLRDTYGPGYQLACDRAAELL